MDVAYRRIIVLSLLALALLVPACTRERPLPSATSTPSEALKVTPTAIKVSDSPPDAEEAPNAEEAKKTGTPEPDSGFAEQAPPETFQYTVQPGDTLLTIAIKFDSEVEIIQKLNALRDELLSVGQPLYVPYVDGMTAEGMPTPTPGPYPYVVQGGDTLGGIALKFGVDHIALTEYNNILSPDSLTVGSTIMIPNYSPPYSGNPGGGSVADDDVNEDSAGAASDGYIIHIVQSGEGLFEIAELYGISPDEIALANGVNDTNLLRVGQELIIPGISPRDAAASRGSIHVVQAGESLLGIAIRYGVTTEEILAANELTNPDSLDEGQELIIPGQ